MILIIHHSNHSHLYKATLRGRLNIMEDTFLHTVAAIMSKNNISIMPVVEREKLRGLLDQKILL